MKLEQARVIVSHSDHGMVQNDAGTLQAVRHKRSMARPLPGDLIDVDDQGQLCAVQPRRSTFGRGDHKGRFKPTAANIDQLLIVIATDPTPSIDLLTRYLVMAELNEINATIVVNKADLGIPDQAPFTQLDALGELGYPSEVVSSHDPESLKPLHARIQGRISLLAGQSGVGKSSLLNAFIPHLDVLTNGLSEATGKGKHTTTTTKLYPLPGEGYLADSPGVWEYGLWVVDTPQLAHAFVDFRPFLDHCRFRDCTHHHEPGCAVTQAVSDGQISEFRLDAWHRLLKEQQRFGPGPHHQGKGSPLA
mgnify:CR=1 FL=1